MSKTLTEDQAIAQLAKSIGAGEREDRAQGRAERMVQDRKGDSAPSGRASNKDSIDLDDAIGRIAGNLEREDKAIADELGDDPEPEDDDLEGRADDSESEDADEPEDDVQDDDSDEDVESDGNPWKATRTVKVDGREYEITPDEAIAGYQRQAAFTRRTQELAELRKETQATIGKYNDAMTVIEQAFPGMQAQIAQLRQPAQAAMQADHDTTVRGAIKEAMQSWHDSGSRFDDASRAQSEDAIVGYMQQQGLSDGDIRGVATSALAMTLVEKAMLYDGATGGKRGKAKRPNSPSLRAGSKPPTSQGQRERSGQKQLRQKFHKSGSIEDAVSLLVSSMVD